MNKYDMRNTKSNFDSNRSGTVVMLIASQALDGLLENVDGFLAVMFYSPGWLGTIMMLSAW